MPELSASEDLKRLVELSPADFLKEFSQIREKFKEFLKGNNIAVPSISIEELPGAKTPLGENAMLLDAFNETTIGSMDKNILSVYGTVQAFLELFNVLPNSTILDNLSVKIEGKDALTAKDLQEQFRMGSLPQESQIIVASSDLRSLMPELQGKAAKPAQAAPPPPKETEAVKLDASDLESIFEEKAPEIKAPAPVVTENQEAIPAAASPVPEKPAAPLEKLSALISQEEYDSLFASPVASEAAIPEAPASSDTMEAEPQKLQPAQPLPDDPNTGLSQEELDSLFGGKKSSAPSAKEEAKPSSNSKDSSLSQDELDALFAPSSTQAKAAPAPAPKPESSKNSSLSQDELDALFAPKSAQTEAPSTPPAPKTENGNNSSLSQDELDALFAPSSTQAKAAPAPAPKPESSKDSSLSQNELDALFASTSSEPHAEEPAPSPAINPESNAAEPIELTISQNELDTLLNAAPSPSSAVKPSPKQEALPKEQGAMSQNELDALFSKSNAVPAVENSPGESVELKEELTLSQEELDALLNEETVQIPEKKSAPEVSTSSDSSDNGTAKSPEISYSIGAGPEPLSKEELEKMFS